GDAARRILLAVENDLLVVGREREVEGAHALVAVLSVELVELGERLLGVDPFVGDAERPGDAVVGAGRPAIDLEFPLEAGERAVDVVALAGLKAVVEVLLETGVAHWPGPRTEHESVATAAPLGEHLGGEGGGDVEGDGIVAFAGIDVDALDLRAADVAREA